MAGDLHTNVRFTGNAQQLLATYKAIGAQAAVLQRQINSTNAGRFNQLGLNGNRGPQTKNVTTEIDALNKTLITTAETFLRVGKYGKVVTGTLREVRGDTDKIAAAEERLNTISQRGLAIKQRAIAAYRVESAAIRNAYRQQIGVQLAARRAAVAGRGPGGLFLGASQAQAIAAIDANIAHLRNLERQTRATSSSMANYARTRRLIESNRTRGLSGLDSALNATPPLPAAYQALHKLSPAAIKALTGQGLETTAAGLFGQNAKINISKDLVHGTTRATVAFEKLGEGVRHASLEFDKSGNMITRFGGHLSGLSSFLNQTVRNLQKVIQWGIATTVVFGGLALAASQLSTITDLNKNLNQLSITANLTHDETNALFGDLADIATRTATPLSEITKSADDIALAVRGAGKSAQEYRADILNLTEAVGIYTNLTGEDTVKATDLLVSSMKQLGLQTEDVTGLLSKITAVAGGQSNAISDITQGLAVMAEAARQAGLSVDETIAAVQVLSQVTAKSPSEIATAFKNLVGALDSRAGAKALASFNIDLRDSAGNLRNILDIYGEISDKIRQGIIPADEVKGLVKAIAGGPRRAPDAAALLSAIDQISASEAKSLRATNEALIVNAKALDTIQAKLVQLQVQFDRFAFETFGEGFKEFVTIAATGLTSLLQVLNKVPSGFISAALQLGVFLVAVRLGISAVRLMTGAMQSLLLVTAQAPGAFLGAAKGITATGTAAGRFAAITGGGKNIGSIVAGGAIGAIGGAAVSGGNPLSAIAGGLTGVGLGALTTPLPWLKVGGAIALAAGTLLEFTQNSQKAADVSEVYAQKAEKVIQAFTSYSAAKQTVDDIQASQDKLKEGIDNLNSKTSKNADELAQLQDYQKEYITNTLAMADANLQLNTSFNTLKGIDAEFAAAIQAAQAGTITQAKLEEFIQRYQLQLLQQTNPNAQLPTGGFEKPVQAPIQPFSLEGQDTASYKKVVKEGFEPITELLNLTELERDANRVKDLFTKSGDSFNATIVPTSQNIGKISNAIAELTKNGDELAPTLQATFNEFVKGASAVDGANVVFASFQNRIDALKQFLPSAAAELQKLLDLGQQTAALAAANGDSGAIFGVQQTLSGLLSGGEINTTTIKPLLDAYAKQVGLGGGPGLQSGDTRSEAQFSGATTSAEVYDEILKKIGIDMTYLDEVSRAALEGITEDTLNAIEAMDSFAKSIGENAATQSAQLQAQIQGGEFKGDSQGLENARKQIEYLDELAASVNQVNEAYAAAAEQGGAAFEQEMGNIAEGLTNINGLQDAQNLSSEQLIERLFNLADTYGLTGKQVDKLGGKIIKLISVVDRIAKLRVKFGIQAGVDLSQAIKSMKALQKAAALLPGGFGSGAASAIGVAISQLSSAQADFGSLSGGISSIYKGGGGSSSSGGGSGSSASKAAKKTGAGKDISTLDLPEEIANAANRDALIKKAIANAKKLQKQIPGASAEGKNDIVELLKGTQRVLEVRGVKDDLLRKALEELAEIEKKRLEFETKADTIRRIRVGGGDFSAIANVPVNSQTGVSLGGANNVNVTLNLNGSVLTPAQFAQFADMIAAALKRQIAN